ncbi:MAG: alpha-amylase family glycosyl hydrolase [Rhodospirillales bacterium]
MAAGREWWRGAVIYQIYPRSFQDSDGDGVGDLPGILARLDHVASLGADAIWLSPFFASPQRDFGYDVSDYCAVDPLFGTLADFDRLVARAHALGLKIVVDMVWSHTSDAHPWFEDSRAARDGECADWYVWADPLGDGRPPNNWLSVFGGGAWTWEPRRRQYYLHHFLASQPKLNLRSEVVCAALFDAARFWIDRGVDGFRLDAVDFMFHDASLRDNPPMPPGAEPPTRPFRMQFHLHDMMQPETLGFLARLRRFLDDKGDVVALAEVSSEEGAFDRCGLYTQIDSGSLHMAYTLGLMKRPFAWENIVDLAVEAERAVPHGALCWMFSNHDVERAVSRWSGGRPTPAFARLLMALLLTLRGGACVYQGEELGLPEAEVPREAMRDPYGIAFWPTFRGRDGARTPMPWSGAVPHAGFTAGAAPWLPVPAPHAALAVDLQERDPASTLHAWRRFLAWRRMQRDLVEGNMHVIDLPPPGLALRRGAILAVFNLAAAPQRIPLDRLPPSRPLAGHGFDSAVSDGALRLPPHGVYYGRLSA